MSAHDSFEDPPDDAPTGDPASEPRPAHAREGTKLIDLAHVVGSIRAHAPELADDLDDAISVWLGQADVLPFSQASELETRRSRLQALRELLNLSAFEPDPRD